MLKLGAGHYEGDQWVNGWENLDVKALHEGDEIAPWETVMTIEGDYSEFAHLETVFLGVMARRTLIMRNVREVVEAAGGKPILYFPARHDHWLVQTGDGWSAHIGGSIGVSTDAQASWWGGRGIGTVPHGLIAAYGGDTALAARKFADRFGRDMNVTVLVDFVNDSVRTALEVAAGARRGPVGRAAGHVRQAGRRVAAPQVRRRRADGRGRRARRAGARRARQRRVPRTSTSSSPAASPPSASGPSRRPACRSTPTASARR